MVEKGPDEVFCKTCGELIKETDEICPECGVRQFEPEPDDSKSTDTLLYHLNEDRPVLGGILIIVAGLILLYIPLVTLEGFSSSGGTGEIIGLVSLLFGLLVLISGVGAIAAPSMAKISGLAAIILSLGSIVGGTFGGLGLGTLFGVVGGILCVYWGSGESTIGVSKPASTALVVSSVAFLAISIYFWSTAELLGVWIGVFGAVVVFIVVYIIALVTENS